MTDHTEMQIPDDVLAAAYEAMKDPTGGAAMCIARAILSERTRCARIAIRQATATQEFADAPLQELATRIIAKIRSVDK